MTARRGTRLARATTVSGDTTTIRDLASEPTGVTIVAVNKLLTITNLSAVTISCTGVTSTSFGGKINFGQGTAYKMYFGVAPLSLNAPAAGTRLSDGTLQITTGLTTVNQFKCNLQYGGASGGRRGYPHDIHWTRGYKGAGGVTVFLSTHYINDAYSACTPLGMIEMSASSYMAGGVTTAGSSLAWMAIGV